MYPRSSFRSGGTSERTVVLVFVPGEHPNVPLFRFSFRGNTHQNHPFGNHPFANRRNQSINQSMGTVSCDSGAAICFGRLRIAIVICCACPELHALARFCFLLLPFSLPSFLRIANYFERFG